ncbi:hypothetical protein Tco_1490952 [Tanacetum coccineum]
MHANKSFNRNPTNHRLYHALMEALIEDENAMNKGVVDTIKDCKRKHDNDEDDDDEDPLAGPNQGKKTKRRRTKDLESSKKPSTIKETPKGKATSKGSKTGKSASTKEPVEGPTAEVVMDGAGEDVTSLIGITLKEIVTPLYLSKPLPLQGYPCHLTVAADYFYNNDMEYLKSSNPERMYTTSITKTKAARYEIEGIEDIVPMLWSPTKVGYDKDALKGIKHWGEGQNFGVKSVSVKKLYGYGSLEEIVVKRANYHFYKFQEGDFINLHLNDIEDMLLLDVQHKLFHLTNSDIVDFFWLSVCSQEVSPSRNVSRIYSLV